MRTEQLQYFVEVARQRSFSLAAEKLHIAQPSISQAIKNLEQELNVQLFQRSRAGVHLTSIGRSLLPKAQQILNLVDEFCEEARTETDQMEGRVNIAAIPSIVNTFIGETLFRYKKEHPHVRLEVKEAGTNQIVQEVLAEQVHAGVVSCQPGETFDPRIEFTPLFSGTYVVYIGKHSSIPLQNPVPRELIARQPLIALQNEYRQVDYLRRLLGTDDLNILVSLGYTEAAKRMISEGIAIGFYPDFSIGSDPYVQSGDIIPLDIADNELTLQFGWIRSRQQRFPLAARKFIRVLKEVIDSAR
jgi:DNA-binding transcriptional LysR family regulator